MTQGSDNEKHSPPNPVEPLGRQRWFIPVITFVVGLLLGGLVIGALRSGDSGSTAPDAATTPTGSASVPGSGSTASPTTATVVVPAECLKVSDDATAVNDLVRRAVTAARDLDASALSAVVREIDTAQTALRQHAEACKNAQASITGGATPSLTTLQPSASTS